MPVGTSPIQKGQKGAAQSGGNCAAPVQTVMVKALYIALGFWLARSLFKRQSVRIDPLARLRNAGL